MEPTEGNRRAWEARYRAAAEEGLPQLLKERLHDLSGRRVLHLQCGTGAATVDLAALGALVTGVDDSSAAIEAARLRAPDLPWLRADPEHLPAELQRGREDLVYAGAGSLGRIRSVETWAAGIVGALRPGGELILLDEHPISACLDVGLRWRDDYFDDETLRLGRIVNALIAAGLVVRVLDELPSLARRQDPRVPAELLVVAAKPA